MLNEETLQTAVRLLVEAASPRRIILFGSYARGEAGEESDFDFLVLKDKVESRRQEMVRLLRVLEEHRIPADIVVASLPIYEQWKDVGGTVFYEASLDGRVVYDSELAAMGSASAESLAG